MWITPLLPYLPGPLRPGVVAPDRTLSIAQIEQTMCKQMTYIKLWLLYSSTWNHLTVQKRAQACLKMLYTKRVNKSYAYLIYMYKDDVAFNNIPWLICHKIQPNQIKSYIFNIYV